MSKQSPPAPTASAVGPCPTVIQIVGRPGTESLPSTIAPPDHPGERGENRQMRVQTTPDRIYCVSQREGGGRVVRWLVDCFGLNSPLRQYFSLYLAVSQREGERRERIDKSKNVQTTPTRTFCKRSRPLPYCIQIVGRPGTGSLPSTIASGEFTQHHRTRGWSCGAMVLGKLPVPGRPTIWITVGQGPTALAVGAGGGLFGHFYSHLSFLSSFSLSLGDGPI